MENGSVRFVVVGIGLFFSEFSWIVDVIGFFFRSYIIVREKIFKIGIV